VSDGPRYLLDRSTWESVADRWAQFHARAADPHPFASPAWLQTMAQVAGLTLDAWVVRKGDEWVAALAVPRRMFMGRAIAAGLPLAAYSPLLARPAAGHPASRASEWLAVAGLLAEQLPRAYERLDLLLPLPASDARPWMWNRWQATPRSTYVLALGAELQLADSVRRHLRKCREAGLEAVEEWNVEAFREPFSATQARQGFAVRMSFPDLARAAERLHEAGEAWMVGVREPGGRWVAAQILLGANRSPTTYMWLAGASDDRLATGASSLLMVGSAEAAQRRGHTAWDLCGADLPGVARFKAELGAELRVYAQVTAPQTPLGSLLRLGARAARGVRGTPSRADAGA
jgi:hypothetical protein